MAGLITVDSREFGQTLARYMQHTKRDLAEVINRAGYGISMKASKITHKADWRQIRAELYVIGREVVRTTSPKAKRPFRAGKAIYAQAAKGGPLLALIINKRRGQRGEKGLYGAAMKEAMRVVYNARVRSVAFIRSGWLRSLEVFARALGIPIMTRTAKYFKRAGPDYGGAKIAKPGLKVEATLYNAAVARSDRRGTGDEALRRYATEGLRKAIALQTADMRRHIEGKLQGTANRYSR